MISMTLKYIGTYHSSSIILYHNYNLLYDSDEVIVLSDYTRDKLDLKFYFDIEEIY